MPPIVKNVSKCGSAELGKPHPLTIHWARPLTVWYPRTRKINALDFGISFDPTPRGSARSTPQPASQRRQPRTPLTARGAPRRPSKTPSQVPNQQTTANTVGQGSAEQSRTRTRSDVYDGPREEIDTRSRKRRKLSSDHDNAHLVTPATSQVSAPTSFERRSTSGRKSSALPIEIAEGPEQTRVESKGVSIEPVAGSSPSANKENTVPGTDIKESTHVNLSMQTPSRGEAAIRNRPSPVSGSPGQLSENVSLISVTGDVDSGNEILVAVLEESADESLDDDREGVSLLTAPEDVPDTTMELVAVLDETNYEGDEAENTSLIDPRFFAEDQAETAVPRSAHIKKKRTSPKTPGQRSRKQRVSSDTLQLTSDAPASQASHELKTPHQQSTSHVHPGSDNSFYQANHDDEDETYLQPTSPVIPTPKTVVKRPRKKKAAPKAARTSGASSSSTQTAGAERKGKPNTFPILIHRHTNISALPTITEEAEPGEEEEEEARNSDTEPASHLSTFRKFNERPNPNAVDVLAQFCREDIEAAIENVGSGTSTKTASTESSSRRELQRKRSAILTFSNELESRLFDLSAAVEHRLSLEARVEQSLREKSEMQARWTEVRRERERVAVRLDELRRRKADKEKEESESRGLSEMLFRLELGMEVDRERDDDGSLEWRLRTVAEGVNATAGGGLLERVTDFNAVLEGLLAVLDQRATDQVIHRDGRAVEQPTTNS